MRYSIGEHVTSDGEHSINFIGDIDGWGKLAVHTGTGALISPVTLHAVGGHIPTTLAGDHPGKDFDSIDTEVAAWEAWAERCRNAVPPHGPSFDIGDRETHRRPGGSLAQARKPT